MLRFALFLADRQGKPLAQVLAENDSQALALWMAYFKVNPPFDQWSAFATIGFLLSHARIRVTDFLPRALRRQREQTPKNPDQWARAFRALAPPGG